MVTLKELFKTKNHPVITKLIINNILYSSGWALINPIFALYVINYITLATPQTVGICYALYWFIKGVLQLYVSHYLDHIDGETDDYLALLSGQFINILVPLALLISKTPLELYLIFTLYGIADALAYPSWNSIFTRYINPKKVSFEWSLNGTGVNLGSAIAILASSILLLVLGFKAVLLLVALAQFGAFLAVFSLRKHFLHKKKIIPEYYIPFRV